MLMQNFKSHDELNIREQERAALIKTLVLLETGKLKHEKIPSNFEPGDSKFTGHFNMMMWEVRAECGTIACLGGTAEMVGGIEFGYVSHELAELFNPGGAPNPAWSHITTAQAATALRSYLTTGSANWSEALKN